MKSIEVFNYSEALKTRRDFLRSEKFMDEKRHLQMVKTCKVLILAFCISATGFLGIAIGESNAYHQELMDTLVPTHITVRSGETAWNIQRGLISQEYDVREVLYQVEKLNPGINIGNIRTGQTVIFLSENTDPTTK